MRAGIVVSVTPQDRIRLEAIVDDRNTRQKHAAHAWVIVATADGYGTTEIMRRSGLSKPVVWRWQERFMQEGVDGLLRDKTRKPGKPPLPAEIVQRVIDLTPADGEGPRRDDDPRLHPQRQHHPAHRAERAGWHGVNRLEFAGGCLV